MGDIDKYDETWRMLMNMARVKLDMNSFKGNIEDIHTSQLVEMAEQELKELNEAIARGNYMSIIEEAADVLNFMTAAVHVAVRNYRGRNDGHGGKPVTGGNRKAQESDRFPAKDDSKKLSSRIAVKKCRVTPGITDKVELL